MEGGDDNDPRAGNDLQTLLCRLADGDRSAFHPVFDRLWPMLRRVAARRLPDDQAEDAAQEALVKILRRVAEFDRSRSGVAWALGIVGYEVRTILTQRRRRREEPMSVMKEAGDLAADPETIALTRDLEEALRAAVGTLRPDDAETLRLYSRGLRPADPPATFRKRVERALARLRHAWRTTHGRV